LGILLFRLPDASLNSPPKKAVNDPLEIHEQMVDGLTRPGADD
jgi:hypothetical protein